MTETLWPPGLEPATLDDLLRRLRLDPRDDRAREAAKAISGLRVVLALRDGGIAGLRKQRDAARQKLAVLADHIDAARSESRPMDVLCSGCVAACEDAIAFLGGREAVRAMVPLIRLPEAHP